MLQRKRIQELFLVYFLIICTTICYVAAQQRDVQYAVIAFLPEGGQSVAVSIDGANYPLGPSQQNIANFFTGTAPAPRETYSYIIMDGQGNNVATESIERRLANELSSGNEFFNRTTLHPIPELPQAYHPIYPRK